MALINRGFRRRRPLDPELAERLPPGQHVVNDFPVLTVAPTPRTRLEDWTLRIDGDVGTPGAWTWDEFQVLPSQRFKTDIHCVTSWSKLGTVWQGVSLDTLLDGLDTNARYLRAVCDGGYDTNLPLSDVTGGKAWIVYGYDDRPLEPEHGGRLARSPRRSARRATAHGSGRLPGPAKLLDRFCTATGDLDPDSGAARGRRGVSVPSR